MKLIRADEGGWIFALGFSQGQPPAAALARRGFFRCSIVGVQRLGINDDTMIFPAAIMEMRARKIRLNGLRDD